MAKGNALSDPILSCDQAAEPKDDDARLLVVQTAPGFRMSVTDPAVSFGALVPSTIDIALPLGPSYREVSVRFEESSASDEVHYPCTAKSPISPRPLTYDDGSISLIGIAEFCHGKHQTVTIELNPSPALALTSKLGKSAIGQRDKDGISTWDWSPANSEIGYEPVNEVSGKAFPFLGPADVRPRLLREHDLILVREACAEKFERFSDKCTRLLDAVSERPCADLWSVDHKPKQKTLRLDRKRGVETDEAPPRACCSCNSIALHLQLQLRRPQHRKAHRPPSSRATFAPFAFSQLRARPDTGERWFPLLCRVTSRPHRGEGGRT
jgi:hypothetical protein